MNKKEIAEPKAGADVKPQGKTAKPPADVMYLGPTISGVARHSTVFKSGSLPPKAVECISRFPVMARLFVPLKEMPSAVKAINMKKGALWEIYTQAALKFIQEER